MKKEGRLAYPDFVNLVAFELPKLGSSVMSTLEVAALWAQVDLKRKAAQNDFRKVDGLTIASHWDDL